MNFNLHETTPSAMNYCTFICNSAIAAVVLDTVHIGSVRLGGLASATRLWHC